MLDIYIYIIFIYLICGQRFQKPLYYGEEYVPWLSWSGQVQTPFIQNDKRGGVHPK